jgi:hypothetical protein
VSTCNVEATTNLEAATESWPNQEKLVCLQRLRNVRTALADAYRKQALANTVWTAQEWEFLFRIGVTDAATYQMGRHGNPHD